MDASCYVDEARGMAAALEDREVVAGGSRLVARAKVARLSGVPASLLHTLRYRPPKTVAADVFNSLCAAIERQAANQIRILESEIATARARRLGAGDCDFREVESALEKAKTLLREQK